ncbi:MAG: hypothetical protein HY701_01110 [Gemmatimonadetes bacterium]|nr:hypothetical protein [Gemmatimonadota bacterium]
MKKGCAVSTLTVALATVVFSAGSLSAQDALDRLETLARDNAMLYVQPVTQGVGTALNQGIFHTAGVHTFFGFHLGVSVSGVLLEDVDDAFIPVLPNSIPGAGACSTNPYGAPASLTPTATVTGPGSGQTYEPMGQCRLAIQAAGGNPSNYALNFPGGLDLPAVPFAVIQGSVGLLLGTEVSVRMIPAVETTEEVGKIQAIGFGVKHSLSQYIPLFPVDVSVYYGKQSLDVGDYVEASGSSYGLIVGKDLGLLTLYGAASRQSADVDVSYTVDNPDNDPGLPADGTKVTFKEELDTETRLTGGLTLNLGPIKLNADYSPGDRNTVSAKLLVSVR